MSRYRRIIRPGDVVHVISRFVNREFRLTGPVERAEYLRRFGGRIGQSDWRVLSYALMSSHIHHGLVAGSELFEHLIKSVHAPFAGWLNRQQGRLGPVFADRSKTLIVDPCWIARLITYHHNNPPRAGVVDTAIESGWTSHRAYLGEVEQPQFLSVELGLELMGYGLGRAARRAFGHYVDERRSGPRDPLLTGNLRGARAALRETLGVVVSVAHPRTGPSGLDYMPVTAVRRWDGPLAVVVELVARGRGLTATEIASNSRVRSFVSARRQVALIAGMLGRSCRETGLSINISETAVRKLRCTASKQEHAEAAAFTRSLWETAV